MRVSLKKNLLLAMMLVIGVAGGAMAASVDSITPNIDDINGGETVEIKGVGFTGATAVRFGTDAAGALTPVTGQNSASFTVVDDSTISALVPAHVKGCFRIAVVTGAAIVSADDFFTYTTSNRVLQVSIKMTVGKNANVAWDLTTDNNDSSTNPKSVVDSHLGSATLTTPTITPYLWFVRDCEFGPPGSAAKVNLAGVYSTEDGNGSSSFTADPDNAHSLVLLNTSRTNSDVNIDAVASDAVANGGGVSWTNDAAAGPGADKFKIRAQFVAGVGAAGAAAAAAALPTGPTTFGAGNAIAGATSLYTGLDVNKTAKLFIEVSTPTSSTAPFTFGAGTPVTQTVTVSLIASAP